MYLNSPFKYYIYCRFIILAMSLKCIIENQATLITAVRLAQAHTSCAPVNVSSYTSWVRSVLKENNGPEADGDKISHQRVFSAVIRSLEAMVANDEVCFLASPSNT